MSDPKALNEAIIVTSDPEDGVGHYRLSDPLHDHTHVPDEWLQVAFKEIRRLNALLEEGE